METTEQKTRQNPLASLMRQPKVYIKLPSQGKYWPEGSLNPSFNGEYPVYSMTAKDELVMKTPDALLNGQATVDVIESCVPNILNAWHTPNIDLDIILIAIRLATYGDKMNTTVKIGEEEVDYGIDLRTLIDQLYEKIIWDEKIEIGTQMAIYIRPINYQSGNKTNMRQFETQKLMSVVNDSALSEEEKIAMFKDSFTKLTDITLGIIHDSVYKIESVAGTTEDPNDIKEFMENCDKEIFDAVKNRLESLRVRNTLDTVKVRASADMIAEGSAEELEIPLVFDASNFFG
jgi:hypothetical protein